MWYIALKCLSGQICGFKINNAGVLTDARVEIIAGSARHTWKISHKNEAERAESGSHFVKKTSDKED